MIMNEQNTNPTTESAQAAQVGQAVAELVLTAAEQTAPTAQQAAQAAADQAAEAAKPDAKPKAQRAAAPKAQEAAPPTAPAPPTEPPKADTQPDKVADLEKRVAASDARALRSEAASAALKLGVPEARVNYALRLAELDGIDINTAEASEKIETAMKKLVENFPELKGVSGVNTGSTGDHARNAGASNDPFLQGFNSK